MVGGRFAGWVVIASVAGGRLGEVAVRGMVRVVGRGWMRAWARPWNRRMVEEEGRVWLVGSPLQRPRSVAGPWRVRVIGLLAAGQSCPVESSARRVTGSTWLGSATCDS